VPIRELAPPGTESFYADWTRPTAPCDSCRAALRDGLPGGLIPDDVPVPLEPIPEDREARVRASGPGWSE
jgi:hypothetical protein